jgi:hypothetical protein
MHTRRNEPRSDRIAHAATWLRSSSLRAFLAPSAKAYSARVEGVFREEAVFDDVVPNST